MNKFGFKNFKVFGSNIQYIQIKPLVLIFGPNSMGKSSCIDALLYYEYLKYANKTDIFSSSYFDINNKYFAGDKFNIGKFEDFVHKKETARTIEYEETVSSKDKFIEIIPLFSLYEQYLDNGLSDYREDNNFENFVKEFYKNRYNKNENEHVLEEVIDDFLFYMKEGSLFTYMIFTKIFKKNDYFNFTRFIHYLEFIEYLGKTKVLTIHTKITKEDTTNVEFLYLLDNKNFIKVISKNKKLHIELYRNKLTILMAKIANINYQSTTDIIYKFNINQLQFINDFSKIKNFIEFFVISFLRKKTSVYTLKSIQYIAPLRVIPTKDDLFITDKAQQILHEPYQKIIQEKIDELGKGLQNNMISFLDKMGLKLEKFFFIKKMKKYKKYLKSYRAKSLKKYILYIPYIFFVVLLLVVFLSITILFVFSVYVPIMIYKMIKIKKTLKLNKSTTGGATNNEMWQDFILSPKIQKEIDIWLGNTKMRTSYKVYIEDILGSSLFDKLLKKQYKKLSFNDMLTKTKVYPNEMGTGISQVLPILISAKIRQNSKIFIEQPELHLHPALQSEIADEFIKSINKNKNEFFLETHSEHLLLRMMKRMRQTHDGTLEDENLKLTPDDVCLLYIDNDGEKTFITELELDEDGSLLDPWPGGFFEEGFKERFM